METQPQHHHHEVCRVCRHRGLSGASVSNGIASSGGKAAEGGGGNGNNNKKSKIESYTSLDVLSGRGGLANKHTGNRVFRRLIWENKELYKSLASKREQNLLIESVLVSLRLQGFRFLKRRGDFWYEITYKEAWQKTSQALREVDKRPIGNDDNKTNNKTLGSDSPPSKSATVVAGTSSEEKQRPKRQQHRREEPAAAAAAAAMRPLDVSFAASSAGQPAPFRAVGVPAPAPPSWSHLRHGLDPLRCHPLFRY